MSGWQPVRWGFIGAGGVAQRKMLPAVAQRPEVQLAAVMVRDLARARALAAIFGADAAYDSVDALLADESVEAVYIATPPHVHAEQVVAAARAGKHILVEKPLALHEADGEAMLAAAAAAGVTLAVCFPMRHGNALRGLKAWLDEGVLGELTYLRAQLVKWYPLEPGAWRADPARSGGGVVVDLGSHLLDAAVWLGGPLAAVSAQLATRAWPVGVEDTATLALRFASGALGTCELSFAVGGSGYTLELYGTRGVATLRDGEVVLRAGDRVERHRPVEDDSYRLELLDFSAALRSGRAPATTGADGLTNLRWLLAAYESTGGSAQAGAAATGTGAA